jgi:hypothetical protein
MERSYPSTDTAGNTLDVPYSGLALGVDPAGEATPLKVGPEGETVVNHATTSIGHGVKVVASAGTDEVLASATPAKWIVIQAQTDNSGIVAVGGAGVDATVATGTGVALAAGESVTLLIADLSDLYVDAVTNGDGVRYTYGA